MRAFQLIKPYFYENRRMIFLGFFFLVLVDALQLFIPRIIKLAIDDLTLFSVDKEGLAGYAFLIVGAAIFIGVFRYGWRRCLIGTSRRIEEGLRNQLFAHIQTLSPSYFSKVATGDLMAHATNDIKNIRMATGMGMVALIDALFLGSATIFFMGWINLRLTFFALLPMPFIVLTTRIFSRMMHKRYRNVQAKFSDLTEGVRERFAGIRVIKAYNLESDSANGVDRLSKEFVDKNIGLVRVTGSFFPLMLMFTNLSLTIVIFLGGHQTIKGVITPGDFVAFISYLGLLTWPMMALGWMTNLIQRGRASLERIEKIIEEKPEINESLKPKEIKGFKGGIEFDNVSFSHVAGRIKTLEDLSFSIKPGGILGVVGPPGSGKTSLLSLVPRLFDVRKGEILMDGVDVRDMGVGYLRGRISFMPQEPFLFEGSVRDNILMGRIRATEEELIKAAEKAAIYDTILGFKHGFDSIVGEKGVILSGGQKQRVALARALLSDRQILILDDPISQVDTATGAEIIDTVNGLSGSKTILVATHRLSVVRGADLIIVLDNGRIVESGTHDELIAIGGYYARTCSLQEIEEGAYEI